MVTNKSKEAEIAGSYNLSHKVWKSWTLSEGFLYVLGPVDDTVL